MSAFISSLITISLFVVIGWWLLRKVAKPISQWGWVGIVVATILASYVGVNARLVEFGAFSMTINDCLQGLGFGVILAFALKGSK